MLRIEVGMHACFQADYYWVYGTISSRPIDTERLEVLRSTTTMWIMPKCKMYPRRDRS
jgi:hypothetical protein